MSETSIELRNLAHLGDAVWELFVREYTVGKTANIKNLHKITTARVNADFQAGMLSMVSEMLTSEDAELVRRARNLPIPIARRSIQKQYRQATAFEALLGFWYLYDAERLSYFFDKFKQTEFFS